MGKASRTKRERREQGGRAATIAAAAGPDTRQLPIFWIVVTLLVVAGLAAIVLTAPNEQETAAEKAAASVPTFEDVSVAGAALPAWSGTGEDDAVGMRVPTLEGTTFEQLRTTWSGDDGIARAYVVVAHWCPHCRDEVPRLVDWSNTTEVPAGVEIVTVSTAVDRGQPNFPPAAWLGDEQWPYEVMIDDELGSAAEALGVEGYPFLVFVDGDGIVQSRYSGEMPVAAFDAAITELASPAGEAAAEA